MSQKEANFIRKYGINVDQIMYLTKKDRRTIIHFADKQTLATFCTIKGLVEEFPEGSLKIINKGVAIAPSYVSEHSHNAYHMTDDVVFRERVHSTEERSHADHESPSMFSWKHFSVMDNIPIAFCVIEVISDGNNRGVDFVFRYCNNMMTSLEGKSIDEMVDHSFYSVFENGDSKWLDAYSDVAMNGVTKVIESYSPEINKHLRIYCYSPKHMFCGCALIEVGSPYIKYMYELF